jgi:hypothetical protein
VAESLGYEYRVPILAAPAEERSEKPRLSLPAVLKRLFG